MLILEGVPDSKYGTFLTAKMNIAAENLENAEAAHTPHYKPQESQERAKRWMHRDFECIILDV